MSVLLFDGFDYGLPIPPKWTDTLITHPFAANSGRRTDTGALRLTGSTNFVKKAFTQSETVVVGFAAKGWGEGVCVELRRASSGTKMVTVEFGTSPSHFLIVRNGVSNSILYTSPHSNTDNSEWTHFEFKIQIGASGSIVIRRDGVEIDSASGINTAGSGAAPSYADILTLWAAHAIPAEAAQSTYYDDLYLLSASDAVAPLDFLGPTARVDTLYPNATLQAQWTPNTGTSNHAVVNESPYDLSDYVETSGSVGTQDLYLLDPLSYSPDHIYGVCASVMVANDSPNTALAAAPVIRLGATDYSVNPGWVLSETQQLTSIVWPKNPATNAEWTRSQVAAMAAGVRLTDIS